MKDYMLMTSDEMHDIYLTGHDLRDAIERCESMNIVMLIAEYGSPLSPDSQWYVEEL